MARVKGGKLTTTNFENISATPLDAKKLVDNENDLENIPNTFKGLTVTLKSSGKTFICIDPDSIAVSMIGSAINSSVWAEILTSDIDGGEWS
jgi:hypothetical protein